MTFFYGIFEDIGYLHQKCRVKTFCSLQTAVLCMSFLQNVKFVLSTTVYKHNAFH